MNLLKPRYDILFTCNDSYIKNKLSFLLSKTFANRVHCSFSDSLKQSIDMCFKQEFDFFVAHNPEETEMSTMEYISALRNTDHRGRNSHAAILGGAAQRNIDTKTTCLSHPYNVERLIDLIAENLNLTEVESYKAAKFNLNLVNGIVQFSSRILSTNAIAQETVMKTEGEALIGDQIFCLKLRIHQYFSEVLVGFDLPTLKELKNVLDQDQMAYTDEVIGKSALSIIFKNTLSILKEIDYKALKREFKLIPKGKLAAYSNSEGLVTSILIKKQTIKVYLV